MNVCELPAKHPATALPAGSRVMRFQSAEAAGQPFTWQGVVTAEYKAAANHHCGVSRTVLTGETGEHTAFHVRYFEIGPGGHTTLERHTHEHVVIVLRGRGTVQLGETVFPLAFGDAVYVAPQEVHQLRNPSADESFGFLCMVDAKRDRPVEVTPPA